MFVHYAYKSFYKESVTKIPEYPKEILKGYNVEELTQDQLVKLIREHIKKQAIGV